MQQYSIICLVKIFFCFIVCTNCFSQHSPFIYFGVNEGLKHSQILDISQDKNGNLWLGTATRSIYRFDGKKFHEYKIQPGNFSGTLYTLKVNVDNSMLIWIISNLGLIKFNGSRSDLIPVIGDMKLGTKCKILIDKQNTKWVIDQIGQLFQYKNDTVVYRNDFMKLSANPVVGSFQLSDGVLVIYTNKGECFKLNNNKIVKINRFLGNKAFIKCQVSKENDELIFATKDGIYKSNLFGEIMRQYKFPHTINSIEFLEEDKEGNIWFTSDGKLFMFSIEGFFTNYSLSNSIFKNEVVILYKDIDGEIWFSVDVLGLIKYRKQVFEKYTLTKDKHITCLAQLKSNEIAFGTFGDGLVIGERTYLNGKAITSIQQDSVGNIWIGTLKSGLHKIINEKVVRVFPRDDKKIDVYGFSVFSDKILLGTSDGIYKSRNIDDFELLNDSLEVQGYNSIKRVGDSFYSIGVVRGLSRINEDNTKLVEQFSLPGATIYDIKNYQNKSYFLVGEFPYVYRFNDSFLNLSTINLSKVVSNVLFLEVIDNENWFVGSNDGLFRIKLKNDSIHSFKKFGKIDGYYGEELYVGSSIQQKNGDIIFGTVNGAYSYSSSEDESFKPSEFVYITHVDISPHIKIENKDSYFQLPVNLNLPYDHNFVSFTFDYCNLSDPLDKYFQYMLEGFDAYWSKPTQIGKVNYVSLTPGSYKFKVKYINDSNIETIAEYSFHVNPAFWQTIPFYLISSLSIILILLFIIWYLSFKRIERLKLIEQVRQIESTNLRKQMAMDFHDEMGNKLASMITQVGILKALPSKINLSKYLDNFEKNVQSIYHGTKDFIWSIDVSSNNLKEVLLYIRDFGVAFFEKNNISFEVPTEITNPVFDINLKEGFNRNLILIFKEAMTNTVKHSKGNLASFKAEVNSMEVVITYIDNGVGLKNAAEGNGLRNMNTRARKMGAEIYIKNYAKTGLLVQLKFKI